MNDYDVLVIGEAPAINHASGRVVAWFFVSDWRATAPGLAPPAARARRAKL